MSTRRQFLRQTALLSLTPFVPAFLAKGLSAGQSVQDDRVLVVVQLDGGNDGLNTVVPYADEEYARLRPRLRISRDDVLRLDDAVGLHPAMKPATELFEDARLAIVQGVGYPNPSRSHFRSMEIWHTARPQDDSPGSYGWLGRALDASASSAINHPYAFCIGDDAVPLAVRGRRAQSATFNSETDLQLAEAIGEAQGKTHTDDLSAFVQRTLHQSYATARQFAESSAQTSDDRTYPNTRLAGKLRLIAKLMKADQPATVYYVSQPGYDTHAAQPRTHENLLREFAGGLKAFLDDLKQARMAERVVVLAFSEFGRRVAENDSLGTDHGTAGPVFLAGESVRSGLVTPHPSLTDLDDGDLRMSIDFRRVYASLLDGWLGLDAKAALGEAFEPLGLFRSA